MLCNYFPVVVPNLTCFPFLPDKTKIPLYEIHFQQQNAHNILLLYLNYLVFVIRNTIFQLVKFFFIFYKVFFFKWFILTFLLSCCRQIHLVLIFVFWTFCFFAGVFPILSLAINRAVVLEIPTKNDIKRKSQLEIYIFPMNTISLVFCFIKRNRKKTK